MSDKDCGCWKRKRRNELRALARDCATGVLLALLVAFPWIVGLLTIIGDLASRWGR